MGDFPPVEGAPQLPQQWARLLITVPFDAHISGLALSTTHDIPTTSLASAQTRVTLDKGLADGLHKGMKIRVGGWSPGSGRLTIDRVEEHAAEGTFESINEQGLIPSPLVVGQAIRIGGATKQEETGNRSE